MVLWCTENQVYVYEETVPFKAKRGNTANGLQPCIFQKLKPVLATMEKLELPKIAWEHGNGKEEKVKSPSSPYADMLKRNLLEGRKAHGFRKAAACRPKRHSEYTRPDVSLLDARPLSGSMPDLTDTYADGTSYEDGDIVIRTYMPDNVEEIYRAPLPAGSQTFADVMKQLQDENSPPSEGPKRKKKPSVKRSPNHSPPSSPRLNRRDQFKSKQAKDITTRLFMNPQLGPMDMASQFSPRNLRRSSFCGTEVKEGPTRRWSDRVLDRPSVERGLIVPEKHREGRVRSYSDRVLTRPTVEDGLIIPEKHKKGLPVSPLAQDSKRPVRLSLGNPTVSLGGQRSPKSGASSPVSPSSPRVPRRSLVKPPKGS